jgi:putative heme-binding domain-containing protein
MPANDLSETETWEIIAYLRSLEPRSPKTVSGDRNAGEKIFIGDGNCALCHMVNGKGGRVGPDLSRVGGARSAEYLTKKLRNPNGNLAVGLMEPGKEWPVGYDVVTVVTVGGQTITGMLRNEDTYSIQLMDSTENLHLYLKKDLRSVTHEERSLMPAYSDDMLSNKQLGDLLAYLDSLRGGRAQESVK